MARDEAYREAEKRIEEARRSGGTSLGLGNLRLTELPESLGGLTQLEYLELSGNRLTALPEWLGGLKQLEYLDLSKNQLTALPEWLGGLTQLTFLHASLNQLTALPDSLGGLKQLKALYLSKNQLTALPEWLGGLAQLRTLVLSNNQLTALPEWLGGLPRLEFLALTNNQLTTLPESLCGLTQLSLLDLSNNQLTTLPDALTRLTALERLFLHGNPKLELSADILGAMWEETVGGGKKAADPRAILAFYLGQKVGSARPLNEVKLLMVGHGRVGKTSLSKALRGKAHDGNEPETAGIERHPLALKAGRSEITAHIWDFGGQEFLHQTHQFFFSERSIYVVVLSGRQGRSMQEAEYWLRLIRAYGKGSPVVIALNQVKAHPFDVDGHFLRERYPEVKAVVRTDCHPRVGIEALRKLVGKFAAGMPSVREKIPPTWARVRTELEDMPDSFVTFGRYREICAGKGVGDEREQDSLATILDCLGIALNYREDTRLRDTSVLKPRWLVDGIYTVLRWLHRHEKDGEMRLEDFSEALTDRKTYPEKMHGFLLGLMEKFELCFAVEGNERVYLVPGLLSENQPRELKDFMRTEARKIKFRYDDVRPPSLLPRFIVRSHTLSHGQPRWRRGVVLARGEARALVRGDHEGRVTDVYALGKNAEDRVWLTEFVLSEMRALNEKLSVRTLVESEAQAGAWTELEVLREEARKGDVTRTERTNEGKTVVVKVKETLREVESPEAGEAAPAPLPLFICYAHADERWVKEFIPGLKVLAGRGYVAPWRDTDLVPGEQWDATIKERLSKAGVIVFIVSREFLASKYITEQERPLAMRLAEEKKAVVLPVLLRDCIWEDADFAKFEVLPYKGKVMSSYRSKATAWTLVEKGVMKAVEEMRKLGVGPLRGMRGV